MNKLLLPIVCIFLLSAEAFSQQSVARPSRFLTRFAFSQLTGGVVLLKGQLASFPDSLSFILDTGSSGVSLDSTTVVMLGLKAKPSNRTIRGIDGVRPVHFLYNQLLRLPGLQVDSLDFHVNNYEILTSFHGERIDGIIGYSVLNRYIVKINYDSSIIEFWTKGPIKYPKGGYMLNPRFASFLPDHQVRIRDERAVTARFIYDIGAAMNMMLSSEFIKDSAVLDKERKFYIKQVEGPSGRIDIKVTVVKEVRLGPYRFKKVPIWVFDDVYNITSYPFMCGLIGNDLLRRFNVIMNYEKREFYIRPNTHFNDHFDYAYTGLELFFYEGNIIIDDVASGSPAEKAGLLEGDVVIAINRNFSRNMMQFKTELQNAVGRIKILVFRNNELKEFEFKVKSIL